MYQLLALAICSLCPSLFCLIAAWLWATPESVLAGTVLGGLVGIIAALLILK